MKRLLAFLLLLLLPAGLGGCAPKSPAIGFFLYDGSDTFITEMIGQLTQAVPADYRTQVWDAGGSQATQNQQIVEMLEQGADLMVVNAVDRLACRSIVEKCAAQGVKVIFFNREPTADAMWEEYAYYVGAAADSLGKKQAEMVAQLFGAFPGSVYDKNGDGVIQLLILKGEQGHQDAEKRTEHCVGRLQELGYQVEVLATEVADWVRGNGRDAMERLYTQYGDTIELVFANNDDMALGAIDYLAAENIFRINSGGYRQPFVLVGVDGTQVGLEAVEQGLLYGTVLNDSARQADAVLTLAEYILEDRPMADFPYPLTNGHYIYIDGDIITQETPAAP